MSTNIRRKRKVVIKAFCKLLRSGKDYSTEYMYKVAGREVFINASAARHIINEHYRKKVITDDMRMFIERSDDMNRQAQRKAFASKFDLCPREAVLIIPYIKRGK